MHSRLWAARWDEGEPGLGNDVSSITIPRVRRLLNVGAMKTYGRAAGQRLLARSDVDVLPFVTVNRR